jgi:hypothetical protein
MPKELTLFVIDGPFRVVTVPARPGVKLTLWISRSAVQHQAVTGFDVPPQTKNFLKATADRFHAAATRDVHCETSSALVPTPPIPIVQLTP